MVADLWMSSIHTAIEFAIEDDATSDSRSDRYIDQPRLVLSRAPPPLRERRRVGVIFQPNLHLEDARKIFYGVLAAPLGKEVNVSKTSGERINRPGRSNADAAELDTRGCGGRTQHFSH
jgi:hypothetical protein